MIVFSDGYSYRDLKGNCIERTPDKFPYSYDEYCLWKSSNFDISNCVNLYSDRLYSLNPEKFSTLCKEVFGDAGQYFNVRSPKDINAFLNLFLGYNVNLVAITECCNVSSGYPYWCFYVKK